jgi:hypothetical protein
MLLGFIVSERGI